MKYLFILVTFFSFTGCEVQKKNEVAKVADISDNSFPKDSILDLYKAEIQLPKGWGMIEDTSSVKVADATCRYTFHNKSSKLIQLTYGLGADNSLEKEVVSARFRKAFIENKMDTSHSLFSDNPTLIQFRKQRKLNVSEIVVAGFNASLYETLQPEKGLTGIYIDSIGEIAGNVAQLTMYSENLDNLESAELKKVFSTLKLKHFE